MEEVEVDCNTVEDSSSSNDAKRLLLRVTALDTGDVVWSVVEVVVDVVVLMEEILMLGEMEEVLIEVV